MADDVLAIIESPQGEMFCPHCEHFIDWHMGLPFDGGPNREWRFRTKTGPLCSSCALWTDEELAALSGSAVGRS